MADRTGIEWTDASWNPIRGCSRVSEGCRHCYAETVAARFSGPGQPYEGLAGYVTRPGGRREARWTGRVDFVPHMLEQPLRWRWRRRIFVNSMSDLFHESIPDDWIDRIFAVMALAPRHTFQLLTKRPERMLRYMTNPATPGLLARALIDGYLLGGDSVSPHATGAHWPVRSIGDIDCPDDVGMKQWPLPNVWLGVSVEDQATADERIPLLLSAPAAVRWISAEPLLEAVDLESLPDGSVPTGKTLDWVVVGGESGPDARPFDLDWARSLVDQCQAAGVAVFVKQLGSRPVREADRERGLAAGLVRLTDRKGADPAEWPAELRVQQYPAPTDG